MARPKVREGEVSTCDRLLAAAEQDFATHGFHGAKLADIAEAAGISRPSLLYHYGSKHALYSAVVRRVLSEIGAAVARPIAREGPFAERLEGVIRTLSDFVRARPTAARLIVREVLDDQGPGQRLIVEVGVPVLDGVERFVREDGQGLIPPGMPVRHALLAVMSDIFLRRAMGPVEQALWGNEEHSVVLTRRLLLEDEGREDR